MAHRISRYADQAARGRLSAQAVRLHRASLSAILAALGRAFDAGYECRRRRAAKAPVTIDGAKLFVERAISALSAPARRGRGTARKARGGGGMRGADQ